jgi:hypothetical protein
VEVFYLREKLGKDRYRVCQEHKNLPLSTHHLLVRCSVYNDPRIKFVYNSSHTENKRKFYIEYSNELALIKYGRNSAPCILNWDTSVNGRKHLKSWFLEKPLRRSKSNYWVTNNTLRQNTEKYQHGVQAYKLHILCKITLSIHNTRHSPTCRYMLPV